MANKINLDSMSAEELKALIDEAKAKLDSKKDEARAALLEEMTERATALGLSLDDLMPGRAAAPAKTRKPRSDAGKTGEIKYRGPGGLTWTGRGRKPNWLSELEAQGKKKEDFAV